MTEEEVEVVADRVRRCAWSYFGGIEVIEQFEQEIKLRQISA
jgi:hypothetical protein